MRARLQLAHKVEVTFWAAALASSPTPFRCIFTNAQQKTIYRIDCSLFDLPHVPATKAILGRTERAPHIKQRAFHPVTPRTQHRTFRSYGGVSRNAQQEERWSHPFTTAVAQQLYSFDRPFPAARSCNGIQPQPTHAPRELR